LNESEPTEKSLLAQAKALLQEHQTYAKKGLGQNFLVNSAILNKITSAANLTPQDLVIEVGPGLGVLTRRLIEKCGHVIAVELDERMVAVLNGSLGDQSKLTLIQGDILLTDPATLVEQSAARFGPEIARPYQYKLVANLPYYITQPIIRHFCESSLKPTHMVVMVQKEVAKNIVAAPGDMGILAISVQFYGRPRIAGIVPAGNFYPVPKVDSAILEIEIYPQPAVPVTSTENFFKTVRAGFSSARKQLINSLSHGLSIPKPDVLALMQTAGVEPSKRAETLTLAEWASLEKLFSEVKKQ
jgi:16S rRNA (adenine1518-N6/adenine1519-N6)-dimethyltransferase